MTETLEEYLKRELSRMGYPLELEISSILDKDYSVWNNEYYFDWDENKAREVDITAYPLKRKYDEVDIKPFRIVNKIAIECKKSYSHAWIFLTRPKSVNFYEGQCMDFLGIIAKDPNIDFLGCIIGDYDYTWRYDFFDRVANRYAEIKYQGKKRVRAKFSRQNIN